MMGVPYVYLLPLMLPTAPPPYSGFLFSHRGSLATAQFHLQETHRSIPCHLPSFTITPSTNNYPALQTNNICLHTDLLLSRTEQQMKKTPHTNTRTQLTKMMIFSQSLSSQLQHAELFFFKSLLHQSFPIHWLNSLRVVW